jgi:integrase
VPVVTAFGRAAVRWKWIAVNPVSFVEPPPIPAPDPTPPSPQEAAAILAEAFKDPDWGTLVRLAMVVGARRGELSALRWADLDLERGILTVGRSIGQIGGRRWEKDTKTHQRRRISLDAATVQLLDDHRARCTDRCTALGIGLYADAYVFSLDPDNGTPLPPGHHHPAVRPHDQNPRPGHPLPRPAPLLGHRTDRGRGRPAHCRRKTRPRRRRRHDPTRLLRLGTGVRPHGRRDRRRPDARTTALRAEDVAVTFRNDRRCAAKKINSVAASA